MAGHRAGRRFQESQNFERCRETVRHLDNGKSAVEAGDEGDVVRLGDVVAIAVVGKEALYRGQAVRNVLQRQHRHRAGKVFIEHLYRRNPGSVGTVTGDRHELSSHHLDILVVEAATVEGYLLRNGKRRRRRNPLVVADVGRIQSHIDKFEPQPRNGDIRAEGVAVKQSLVSDVNGGDEGKPLGHAESGRRVVPAGVATVLAVVAQEPHAEIPVGRRQVGHVVHPELAVDRIISRGDREVAAAAGRNGASSGGRTALVGDLPLVDRIGPAGCGRVGAQTDRRVGCEVVELPAAPLLSPRDIARDQGDIAQVLDFLHVLKAAHRQTGKSLGLRRVGRVKGERAVAVTHSP